MLVRARQALEVDLDQASVRRGLIGTLVVLVTILLLTVFGQLGLTGALAALLVIVADQPGSTRERWIGVLVVTMTGAGIAFLVVWAGDEHLGVIALVAMAITALGTLTSGFGHAIAVPGLVLSLWAVIALSFAGVDESALALASAFLAGGLVARQAHPLPARRLRAGAGDLGRHRDRAWVTWFSQHPIWPALTVLLVMRPKLGEAFETGVVRTVGTLGGVLLAEAVVLLAGGQELIIFAAYVLAAFAMAALHGVNYVVFVLFVTPLILLAGALLGGDVATAAVPRIAATLLGAAIALAGIGIAHVLFERDMAATPSTT